MTPPVDTTDFHLEGYGLFVRPVLRNLGPAHLYEEALRYEAGTSISSAGAMIAFSGEKTGRSPGDKRIARNPESESDIWWGNVNVPVDELTFEINRERAKDYLNTRQRLYVVDAYAGWDPAHRVKVRVVCARAYHALFMWNMLIRPTSEELENFGEPDYVIYNAGRFPANRHTTGMSSKTSVDISFEDREMVILGTEYAGEMKKGVFTVMNYLMPKQGMLSMHCSATASKTGEDSSLLFGLSGTGKTTLSADPKRRLIGDDEHVWSDQGVFNIEGGCYAKAIGLSAEREPDIFHAIRFGAVMENVVFDPMTHVVDFDDGSITENTRVAYPIEFIDNIKHPCVAGHPTDVIFLTCDAFGVLPPVSRLTPEQAMYHFISGYTAKVAGTEVGVTEPQATFSPCFGGPFLVWPPAKYAQMLAEKMQQHGAHAYLVNTGWTGGGAAGGDSAAGGGSGGGGNSGGRIPLKHTRAIVDAIHSGALRDAPTKTDPVFGLHAVSAVPEVPGDLLDARSTWADPAAYDAAAQKLAGLFKDNFAKYADDADPKVAQAGPG
ncbi:MAG: phosphoenolpyruvate carboxykinase (ATP) [Planctomycetota bacterium]